VSESKGNEKKQKAGRNNPLGPGKGRTLRSGEGKRKGKAQKLGEKGVQCHMVS